MVSFWSLTRTLSRMRRKDRWLIRLTLNSTKAA